MSNKYDSSEHIKVLAEILTLQTVMQETQVKINALDTKLEKIKELEKERDEIPF